MAYYPGAGVKKPLNVIQGPLYPEIKQSLPRFVDAGKHWTVDTGATVRETEHMDQSLNGAVLAQSRAYNKTIYGESSSKDVVNKNFRPPLLSQDDFLPLSRQPRKMVVPRINPGSVDSFFSQNNRPSAIESYLTDRIKKGEWRPTFFCPITLPDDTNWVLPDLELTIPNYTASAGLNTLARIDAESADPILDREDLTALLLDAGRSLPIQVDGDVVHPHNLPFNRPPYSAHAGMNTPAALDPPSALTKLSPPRSLPQYSVSGRMNTPVELDATHPLTRFSPERTLPAVSVTSGTNVPVELSAPSHLSRLDPARSLPVHTADARMNVPVELAAAHPLERLKTTPNRPSFSADAGWNVPTKLDEVHPLSRYEPKRTLPAYSADAGANPPVVIDGDFSFERLKLDRKSPSVHADAGFRTPVTIDMQNPLSRQDLPLNRPAYSAGARMNTPAAIDYENPLARLELGSKLDDVLFSNPGSTIFDGQNYQVPLPEQLEKVHLTIPEVTYTVPAKTSVRSENNRSFPPIFPGMKEKVAPDVSQYVSAGPIPQKGLSQPQVLLRNSFKKILSDAVSSKR